MDRIIFGDNQFFGVNHMSEDAALRQSQRFRTPDDILRVLEYAKDIGIQSFMFTTHDQLEPVFEKMQNRTDFKDFKLLPCMPYAHKYANAMIEGGLFAAIKKFVPGNVFSTGVKGLKSIATQNPVPIMQILVDSEMKILGGQNVEAIFLQSVATDFVLGLEMDFMLGEFAEYVTTRYGVKAGFVTQNHAKLHKTLIGKLGFADPVICSGINKLGFRMNPSQEAVESAIKSGAGTTIAMSVLASGAIRPREAVEYIADLGGVDSILFGASTPEHILETKELIDEILSEPST